MESNFLQNVHIRALKQTQSSVLVREAPLCREWLWTQSLVAAHGAEKSAMVGCAVLERMLYTTRLGLGECHRGKVEKWGLEDRGRAAELSSGHNTAITTVISQ